MRDRTVDAELWTFRGYELVVGLEVQLDLRRAVPGPQHAETQEGVIRGGFHRRFYLALAFRSRSTRRFSLRPSAVSLPATGWLSP